MSHKVHPKVFRIRETADWDSRWLDRKRFSDNLEEDFRIREFVNNKLAKVGIEKIEIISQSKTRRAKLYYIRTKAAKEIRKKMKQTKAEAKKPVQKETQEEKILTTEEK